MKTQTIKIDNKQVKCFVINTGKCLTFVPVPVRPKTPRHTTKEIKHLNSVWLARNVPSSSPIVQANSNINQAKVYVYLNHALAVNALSQQGYINQLAIESV